MPKGNAFRIPNSLIERERQRLPERVGLSINQIDSEAQQFNISYKYYNDKMCQIMALEKNKSNKAHMDLREIGSLTSTENFRIKKIDFLPVYNRGKYKKLFSGLPEDIELKEHKLQATARIFYFIINDKKLFNLVAITNTHFETDKVQR